MGQEGLAEDLPRADFQVQYVRCCSSCQWLSHAFCFALLKGRYQDATQIYDTGNVNLRTSFADIRGESMVSSSCSVSCCNPWRQHTCANNTLTLSPC